MKLTNFQDLWSSVRKFDIGLVEKTELSLFNEIGVDTDLSDVFESDNGELLTILKDGSIRKTVAYISERPSFYDEKGWAYPKYHIFECQTLTTMRNNDRGHRYKKTMRDDGTFYMIVTSDYSSKEIYKDLVICQYCFNQYKQHYQNTMHKEDFSIKKFFSEEIKGAKPFIDIADDYTTVPRHYTQSWKKISNYLKEQRNHTCQVCSIQLKGKYSRYLHTHHMDGNPSRNIVSNLKVLCIECHSKEYNHNHLKSKSDYLEFIRIKKDI